MYWSNGSTSVAEAKRLPSEITVGGDWSVRFDPDWGPKEAVVFPELISWTESPEPLIRYYSGKAVYENAFDLDKDQIRGRKVLLDLGNVQDVAVIRVNGHEFPVSWCSPYEVDITPYVRGGTDDPKQHQQIRRPGCGEVHAGFRPVGAGTGQILRTGENYSAG